MGKPLAQHPPRHAQPVHRSLVEEDVDQRGRRRPDGLGLGAAPLAGQQEPRHLLRRQMVEVRLARTGLAGAGVRGHELVVGRVELDRAGAAAYPQRLPHQAKGRRVVGLLEADVAVAVQQDLLP